MPPAALWQSVSATLPRRATLCLQEESWGLSQTAVTSDRHAESSEWTGDEQSKVVALFVV